MSDERRYSDDEVEVILHRAVERSVERRQQGSALPASGMTLGELEEIGREVGVSPQHVREAAASLDRVQGIRREWGLPLSVYHTVPLSRDLSHREWTQLVADLRQTFRAKGKVEASPGTRAWTNGNLHAFVEPGPDGWRLRMGTTKGDAKAFVGAGGAMLLMTLLFAVSVVLGLGSDPSELLAIMSTLGPIGLAFLGAGALQLPSWSRERQEQMEQIERRLLGRMAVEDRVDEDE